MVKYITECPGVMCCLDKKDIVRKSFKDSKSHHVCKKHGGKVIQKQGKCEDCGEQFYMVPFGRDKVFCNKCLMRKQRTYRAEYRRKKQAKTAKYVKGYVPFSVHRRGDYCACINDCYRIARSNEHALSCDSCKAYTPIIAGVDPEILGYWI